MHPVHLRLWSTLTAVDMWVQPPVGQDATGSTTTVALPPWAQHIKAYTPAEFVTTEESTWMFMLEYIQMDFIVSYSTFLNGLVLSRIYCILTTSSLYMVE